MKLFETLALAQRQTPFYHSEEYSFFIRNAYRLSDTEMFSFLSSPESAFDVIRANIIIRSIINKERIEKAYRSYLKLQSSKIEELTSLEEYMANAMSDLPYLKWNDKKIYVPIFPISLTKIYSKSFEKLALKPYKHLLKEYQSVLIDTFDYYSYAAFSSYFTRLITVKKTDTILVSYDYDSESIYFINDQGRLEERIALFDKELPSPNKNHMIKRIERVVDAYLNSDRSSLIEALKEEKLISEKLLLSIENKSK